MKFPFTVTVPVAPTSATVLVMDNGLNVKLPKVCPIKLRKTVATEYDPVTLKFELTAHIEVVNPSGKVTEEVA